MAEVEVVHDGFIDAVAKKGAQVSIYNPRVYCCDFCGCLFLGQPEGPNAWYPDRFAVVGPMSHFGDCNEECPCHDLARCIDANGDESLF